MAPAKGICDPLGNCSSFLLAWSGGRGLDSHQVRPDSSMEIRYEIFSTVILSLLLIEEGQLSVSGERICTSIS